MTEKSIFEQSRLHDSLADLEKNAPKSFEQMISVLGKMASDSIDNSHVNSRPARGAIAVDKALKDYLTEVKG